MAENQSGLTHKHWICPPKLENAPKMCFRSCWKLMNFKILAICSHWMHIFYYIFRQFKQFPVLDFELGHSGSQPFNCSEGGGVVASKRERERKRKERGDVTTNQYSLNYIYKWFWIANLFPLQPQVNIFGVSNWNMWERNNFASIGSISNCR